MYAYSAGSDTWHPVLSSALPFALPSLRVATYNVWFDAYENALRCAALLAILEHERPDVIALQEVTQPFLDAVLESPWVRDEYAVSRTLLDPTTRYDVVMLSRLPVAAFRPHLLTSQMGRRLHVLELPTSEGTLAIGGIHLESMQPMTPTRLRQIDECVPVLCGAPAAIWLGDFNASPDSAEDRRIRAHFRDTWAELSSEPGYTRDTTQNAMLAKIKDDRHQRIDRIFLHGDMLLPRAVRMVGTEPVAGTAGQVFPSDHFGLVADFERRMAKAAE